MMRNSIRVRKIYHSFSIRLFTNITKESNEKYGGDTKYSGNEGWGTVKHGGKSGHDSIKPNKARDKPKPRGGRKA